jgi:hypothetical protein
VGCANSLNYYKTPILQKDIMISGLTAIYLDTELHIPPLPDFRISDDKIVAVYNKLKEPSGYPYKNIDLQSDPPTLSTKREDGESNCKISNDKIDIEEEQPDKAMTIDDFVHVVKTVVLAFGPDVVPFFVVQRCTMRFLVQAHGSNDVIILLAKKIANVYDKIDPFGRPPSHFGIKFRFGPGIINDDEEDNSGSETDDEKPNEKQATESPPVIHKNFITLRFESYGRNPHQVVIDVDAHYPEPIEPHELEKIAQNIRETYNFVNDNAVKFLNQFDTKDDAGT